jgi:hypothetical protein
MVAEKAADLILGRPAPPPAQVPVWEAPDWRTRQRCHPPGAVLSGGSEASSVDRQAEMA